MTKKKEKKMTKAKNPGIYLDDNLKMNKYPPHTANTNSMFYHTQIPVTDSGNKFLGYLKMWKFEWAEIGKKMGWMK